MKPRQPPADVLFLGSSRTVRGIVPQAVEEALQEAGEPGLRALNLAVNGTPRHANYLELADWLEDHAQPRIVVVEVGVADVIPWPHEMLPRFMGARDAARVVLERPYYWRSARHFRSDPTTREALLARSPLHPIDRASLHLELALEVLGRGPEDMVRAAFGGLANGWDAFHEARAGGARLGMALATARGSLGNPYWGGEPPITAEAIEQQVADRGWYRVDPESQLARDGKPGVAAQAARVSLEQALERRLKQDLAGSPLYAATRLYTRGIEDLCRSRGIRLVFLFLPGFREERLSGYQEQYYRAAGELYEPDLASLWREELYQDPGHLTIEGARWLSAEIGAWLARSE
jgi:hypothetical protein